MTNDSTSPPSADEPKELAPEEDRPPTDADYGVAFSPRQVAGGFAIVAALIVLLARWRRGRKKG